MCWAQYEEVFCENNIQSDLQRIWQILRNWFCWRQMLHFDKRWLISLWYRQKPCIVGSIEMMVQQDRKGLWAWLLMLFIVLLEERRIINGYQRCTFDNEITNFSAEAKRQISCSLRFTASLFKNHQKWCVFSVKRFSWNAWESSKSGFYCTSSCDCSHNASSSCITNKYYLTIVRKQPLILHSPS